MKFVTETTLTATRPPRGLIFGSLFRADFTVFLKSPRMLVLNLAVPIIVLVIFSISQNKGDGSNAAGLTAPRIGAILQA